MRGPHVRRCVVAALCAACAGLLLAACSSSPPAPSGARLVGKALANAKKATWVHEEVSATMGSHTLSMTNDIGRDAGRQVITVDGSHATVIVVGGTAYVQADQAALTNYFQFPAAVASKLAGQWISLSPSDASFAAVTEAVTIVSDFTQVRLTGPYIVESETPLNGQKTIPIVGKETAPGKPTVAATFSITATGKELPVTLASVTSTGTASVSWSNWGVPVAITAPAGAVPISSVAG